MRCSINEDLANETPADNLEFDGQLKAAIGHLEAGETDQAMAILRPAVDSLARCGGDHNPALLEPLFLLAMCHRASKHPTRALRTLDRAIGLIHDGTSPDDAAWLYVWRGRICSRLNYHRQSMAAYSRALGLGQRPEILCTSYAALGFLHLYHGDPKTAVRLFETEVSTALDYYGEGSIQVGWAYVRLAHALERTGATEKSTICREKGEPILKAAKENADARMATG